MSASPVLDRQELDAPPDEIPAYILDAAEAIAAAEPLLRPKSVGRKSLLTATTIVKLLTALRQGLHPEPACRLAGISWSTFRNWCERGDDAAGNGPYAAFVQAVKVAEAEAEYETLGYVRNASKLPQFWAAGMTFLERRHPDRWRRPSENAAVQVNVGIVVGIQASDDQRKGLVPQMVLEQVTVSVPALSPPADTLPALSPDLGMAVSDDLVEAKATPIDPVSPANVA